MTTADLFNLFNSGSPHHPRAHPNEYQTLRRFLDDGNLTLTSSSYSPAPEPLQASITAIHALINMGFHISQTKQQPLSDDLIIERLAFSLSHRGSGGKQHGLLKWWAWNWLRDQGEDNPVFEQQTRYGIADLIGPRNRLYVECGDTAPDRVMTILSDGQWTAYVLFPFPSFNEQQWRAEGQSQEIDRYIDYRVFKFFMK